MQLKLHALLFGLFISSITSAAWSADKPVVLVAGATGQTGTHIVRILNEKGFAVRGLLRYGDKPDSKSVTAADWIEGDVREPQSLKPAFKGAVYAISAIGSREKDGPNNFENVDWLGNRNLIDAAKAAGVKRFVLMTSGSAGTGDWNDPQVQRFGAGRLWKGKAEAHLRASGLPYTIIGPGGLRDYAGGEKGIVLRPRNQYSVSVISRADVAAVMVECLTNAACTSKTITTVNSDQAKPSDWIQMLTGLPIDTPMTIRGVAAQE